MSNYFADMFKVNVNEHTEKKNGLTYLSWAWAIAEVKKRFPDAVITIYENEQGWNYFTDGRTAWTKVGLTIGDKHESMTLPIMDYKNKSIPLDSITSFDVNKTIMRNIAKIIAVSTGLGLYLYQGEDIPEIDADSVRAEIRAVLKKKKYSEEYFCISCNIDSIDKLAVSRLEGCLEYAKKLEPNGE